MKWVDVRNELPEDSENVVIVGAGFEMAIAYYDSQDDGWVFMPYGDPVEGVVEFWMRLPDPPGAELADN